MNKPTAVFAGLSEAEHGQWLLGGMPDGFGARVVAEMAASAAPRPMLFVARDDARRERMADALKFFAPDVTPIVIPAWDCLPYDRVSPRSDLVARRVDAFCRLLEAPKGPRIVLTTVNALLQRVPPREMLEGAVFSLRAGEPLDTAALTDFLTHNGFTRCGTVMEAGEFAVRGGIIDLFPPGAEEPLRLDLFGDVLEEIRRFDPMSQRSAAKLDGFDLTPVSELLLTDESIAHFRSGYRQLFGAVTDQDPLFEAISAGRHYPGMEHWLPLFHDKLETLFDMLPDAIITLDYLCEQARDDRIEAIQDFYEARLEADKSSAEITGGAYKPIPPERFFLKAEEWNARLEAHTTGVCAPFSQDQSGGALDAGGRQGRDFVAERKMLKGDLFDAVGAHIGAEQKRGRRIVIAAWSVGSRERMARLLAEHEIVGMHVVENWHEARALPPGAVTLATLPVEHGFVSADMSVIAEQDLLGERLSRPQKRKRVRAETFLADTSELSDGDLVVHVDHGIGRYDGLVTVDVGDAPHDCARILYLNDDKLFLPVEHIDMLSRYGSADQPVSLDKLGGAAWQARKSRLKKRVREMAAELIKLAAARTMKPAPIMEAEDGTYDTFCSHFPYEETEDQARAIEQTLIDLSSGRPMDRLICGDVGFGKTEVALRAAFRAALSGKQVAVLVPTTLLSRQHTNTFEERFAGLPVRIAQLSRLVPPKQAAEIKERLATGDIDIVIGTHALLSKSIAFQDLGLLVVDEEQHFGVAHKERLKRLKEDVHVLTLTATPIPRTLQMALTGVRDMSVISTPPVDRLAVRTFILPFDPVVLSEAIRREQFRGGQIFYVCPRIADLDGVAERVRHLAPEAKVAMAHGRMSPRDLEKVMSDFYDGAYDMLISTPIIESGLDLPRVNTMIVHRADMMGLAQLYQLRGRIGRGKLRGYAYLTLPPSRRLTETAHKRLQVIHRLDSLGAGFSLATHDLDIRGAGNLLGGEQSGHIKEVGIELYQHMIEEAVAEAKAEASGEPQPADQWSPQISIGTSVLIPEIYVEDLDVRLSLYRRIARLESRSEIESFNDELADRFGPPPDSVVHLLEVVAIKRLCRKAGVARVDAGPKGAVMSFRNESFANPAGLITLVSAPERGMRLRPDHKLIVTRNWPDADKRLSGVQRMLGAIAELLDEPEVQAASAN